MDEVGGGIEPDDLMDLDDGDGSDMDEDEDELVDDPLTSPLHLPSSGPASTATSITSSPPNNDDIVGPALHFPYMGVVSAGKPLSIKRGRGRPRREFGTCSTCAVGQTEVKPSKKLEIFEAFES